jgi:fructose-bisphosphate aldolase class 1
MNHDLKNITEQLVASGKGILAADETVPTLTKRFDTLGIQSTEESRRTYREMLFTAEGLEKYISGAIMYDETIRQRSSGGTPLAQVLASRGIVPGIKVDTGPSRWPARPSKRSQKDSTDFASASQRTVTWVLALPSGEPFSALRIHYRAERV